MLPNFPFAFAKDLQTGSVDDQMRYFTTGWCFYADVNALCPFVDQRLLQTYMGWTITKLGQTMHFRHMKSIGILLIANGTNNTFESISPILFENQRVGWVRHLYKLGAEYLGGDKYDDDFAYGTVDFIATLYSAYRMSVLTQNKNRLASPLLFEKPGTGRLFNYVNRDYEPKWINASNAMRIYQFGSTAHKLSLLYGDEGYKYQEN